MIVFLRSFLMNISELYLILTDGFTYRRSYSYFLEIFHVLTCSPVSQHRMSAFKNILCLPRIAHVFLCKKGRKEETKTRTLLRNLPSSQIPTQPIPSKVQSTGRGLAAAAGRATAAGARLARQRRAADRGAAAAGAGAGGECRTAALGG